MGVMYSNTVAEDLEDIIITTTTTTVQYLPLPFVLPSFSATLFNYSQVGVITPQQHSLSPSIRYRFCLSFVSNFFLSFPFLCDTAASDARL